MHVRSVMRDISWQAAAVHSVLAERMRQQERRHVRIAQAGIIQQPVQVLVRKTRRRIVMQNQHAATHVRAVHADIN